MFLFYFSRQLVVVNIFILTRIFMVGIIHTVFGKSLSNDGCIADFYLLNYSGIYFYFASFQIQ